MTVAMLMSNTVQAYEQRLQTTMTEFPPHTLDDDPQETSNQNALTPAPMSKRMIAFAMDFILLVLLLQLLAHFMPKFWDHHTQQEFQNLLQQATLLPQEEQMDSEKMAYFIQESGLSQETYEMLMAMVVWACFLPILYFFIGERFFGGKSLGKATFGLTSVKIGGDGGLAHSHEAILTYPAQRIKWIDSNNSFSFTRINEFSLLFS